ncbi:hypothetical protein PVAND_010771 [Polypedilum vanderplanki]|nr:hypothetical protein PVAND_010771 [Polypedilum vanderplanki]
MNILSQELNYTNSIKIMEGDQPWGVIYSNGTATGAFLEVLENKSDIAFCEYYLKTSRNQFFDSSTVFYSTPLIFVIPMGQKLTNLEKLLQPFNWFVWITLSSTLLIAVIIILIINLKFKSHKAFVYGSNVKHPIINMILGILGNQQTVLPKRNFARFILMMFLILCLVMRSVYQGSLYQFLQSDGRRKEVQSIQEMIDNDFTFYMFESSLDLIQTQTEILSRTKTFKGENFIMKRPLDGSEKIASLEALSDVHVANTDPERDFKLKICKEPLMTMNLVIYFRKSFYLIDEINKKITVLISSGIIDYWLRRSLDDFREVKNNHPRKLNIDDLTGPFNLLIIGHLTSLIIFLIEIFIYKMTLKIQLIRPIY